MHIYQKQKKRVKKPHHNNRDDAHYSSLELPKGKAPSKHAKERMHRYVNVAKAMMKNGITSHGRTFHCSFFVRKSKVQCISWNDLEKRIIKHPKLGLVRKYGEESYNMSVHGEIAGILKLDTNDLSGYSCYNVRIDKQGHCKNSQPCNNCYRMLRLLGIDNIYFYDDNLNICQID